MVIEEKGLLRAMKEAYKDQGYTVAMDDRAGITELIVSGYSWTVVIQKSECPRKILGLIAEHLGEIPEPGTAYQVHKKQVQVEMFDTAMQMVMEHRSSEKQFRKIRRTPIQLASMALWQTPEDKKIVQVNPCYEEMISWSGLSVTYLVGESLLLVDDDVSRLYLHCHIPESERETEQIRHLEAMRWVAE